MEEAKDKDYINPMMSPEFVRILDSCEATVDRVTKAITPVLDERREVLKHLITLSLSVLVVTVSLATWVWNTKHPIVDSGHLVREWSGLGLCLLCALISANALSGARAMMLHVINDSAAINRTLNEKGQKPSPADIAIQTLNKALARVVKDEKRSRYALKLAFILFAYSLIDLMAFGVQQFSRW